MERVAQVLDTKQTPPQSQRRYGSGWQMDRRQAERTIKVAAVAFRRWTAKHHVSLKTTAKVLDVPSRTLGYWETEWERNKLQLKPRGRPTQQTPVEKRNEVVALFQLLGPHVGAPILGALVPDLPRRELGDMLRRLKALAERQRRMQFFTLRWRHPGTVWAIDHCTPPTPIEGCYTQVLSVRDLAGQMPLAWTPVPDGSAEYVRLVLQTLIAEHGAPLLIKKDNGAALNDHTVDRLLAQHGIVSLLSPKATPAYNGACEAGNGSMKTRTNYEAARNGRPARWTADDCEAARMQAVQTARPWGINRPTPEQVWARRAPIASDLRARFQRIVTYLLEEERKQRGYLPGIDLPTQVEASIHRVAVRRALVACRLLKITRGTITLPLTR